MKKKIESRKRENNPATILCARTLEAYCINGKKTPYHILHLPFTLEILLSSIPPFKDAHAFPTSNRAASTESKEQNMAMYIKGGKPKKKSKQHPAMAIN
jgi:hypothetical protein